VDGKIFNSRGVHVAITLGSVIAVHFSMLAQPKYALLLAINLRKKLPVYSKVSGA
jgi:hypothetical protein